MNRITIEYNLNSFRNALQRLRRPPETSDARTISLTIKPFKLNEKVQHALVSALREATAHGKRIDNVELIRVTFMDSTKALDFFKAIGELPFLEYFSARNYESSPPSLQCFTKLITNARSLERFYCGRLQFGEHHTDIADFAQALTAHPTLTNIVFSNCWGGHSSANKILSALSSIPNLHILELSAFVPLVLSDGTTDPASTASLAAIFANRDLERFSCSPRHLFGPNVCLCDMFIPLCNHGLRTLSVCAGLKESSDMEYLARIVKQNKTIEVLAISLWPFVDDNNISILFDGLKHNNTLKTLEFSFKERSNRYKGFSTMIEHELVLLLATSNFTLQTVKLCNSWLRTTALEPWLNLNRYRGRLVKDTKATKNDWVNALAAVNNDVAIIYSLLSMNPSLCDATALVAAAAGYHGEPLSKHGIQ